MVQYLCVMFNLCVSGLIHANHGANMTDYLLNQVKEATSDVSAFL